MEQKTLSIVARAKDEASREMQKVKDSVDQTADAVNKSSGGFDKFTKALDAGGKKISDVGGSMTTKLTLPIVGIGTAATIAATDFNGAMANIATLIPGNVQRVNELKGSIQQLAIDTGKSTADLADGMYQVVSAFGDTADSVKILEVNAKAAKAGLAQTTDAINLTSGVTKAYGDTTGEAVQKASDLALMTVRLGQTTFPELAASMGRVTPLAASLKVSQEELFGAMATFTGVTGGAAEVSTQLRGVLQALMAPTEDMQDLFKKMGVESGQAAIEQFGLQGTIEKIMAAAEKSGQPLQKYIGSIEGQTLALAASGGQADAFTEKIKAMGDVAGTTDTAFAEVTDGVNKTGFQFEQARAKAEVAAQTMGDALAPALSTVSDAISKVADWFMKLNPEQQKTAIVIGGVVAAIGPLLIAIGKMAQGVSAVLKLTKMLANSWVGTAAKATAAAIKTGTVWVAQQVKIAAVATAQAAKTAAVWIASQVKTVASAVGGAIAIGAANVASAAAAAAAWVVANAAMLLGIGLIIAAVVGLVVVIVKNWETIKAAAVAVWEWIKNAAVAVFEAIKTAIMFYINIYVTAFQLILAGAKLVWQGIQAAAEWVFNVIKTVITTYINAYIAIFNWIKDAAIAVWNGIGNALKWVWNNIVSPVINFFKNGFQAIWNTVVNVFNGVKNFVSNTFNTIKTAVGNVFGSIGNAITSPFKAAFNAVAGFWNNTIGKLEFKAPDWVPGIGGKGFSMPKLPMLATGAIATGPTLAMVGEGKEPEAIIPLSKLDSMLENVGKNDNQNDSQQPINVTVNVPGGIFTSDSSLGELAVLIGQEIQKQMRIQGTTNVNMLRAK